MGGLLVRFAGCCNPVPGDDIIGFISRGKGVTIHRADCPNMREVEKDRFIEVSWANETGASFNVSIKVLSDTQATALAVLSAVTSSMNLTITAVNGRLDQKSKQAILEANISLNSKADLETLINKLKQSDKIIDVFRITT
jgi:GTP pyrophosphokinase